MNSEAITCDANNLFLSGMKVRKSSPGKQLTKEFMRDLTPLIKRAQRELLERSWEIVRMPPFIINERGHVRKIQGNIPYDRMIIHSYIDYSLEPELRKFLIYDNYASQVNKGVSLARSRFKQFLFEAYRLYGHNRFYVLLIDFKKFYDNIQHEKLYNEIMSKIPYDPFHDYMIHTILKSFEVDVSYLSDMEYEFFIDDLYNSLDHIYEPQLGEKMMKKSMNIGNQASQLFSLFYPTRIDNYIRVVKGVRFHGRYMDDTSVISDNKYFLRDLIDEIQPICDDMGLFINYKKTQIQRADHDFKYLNRIYRITPSGHIVERLSKDTLFREQIKMRKRFGHEDIIDQYRAWIGNFGKKLTMNQKQKFSKLYDEMISCKGIQI